MGSRRLITIALIALPMIVSGCSLGETLLPDPTPLSGPAAPHADVSNPIPGPIPHALQGRSECFACHAVGAVDAPPVPQGHPQNVDQCTACHAVWTQPGIAAIAPPAISHEVAGREDCLTCHKTGTASTPRIPSNHAGLASTLCRTCHLGGGEIAGATTESAALAAPIPHGREGFSACTGCHEQGAGGAPRFPADHAGRTDDVCSACHAPTDEIIQDRSPGTNEEAAIAEAGTDQQAPSVAHLVEGMTACSACHATGAGSAPKYPEDHLGRDDESCLMCHIGTSPVELESSSDSDERSSDEEDTSRLEVPSIPHSLDGMSACSLCHAEGAGSAPRYPSDHAGRADDTCTLCHKSSGS